MQFANPTAIHPISHPLIAAGAPSWASGWGHDQYGIFADFAVDSKEGTPVHQRMRWLPAGTFQMGSDEAIAESNERPVRDVTLTDALWMFDTPCTQRLWNTVMDKNPSRFVDDDRPVDRVTWHEATEFIELLNSRHGMLALKLPTESQWEYACRATTMESTYAGTMEVIGLNNAPVLDAIAWYGGNSGVQFDLEEFEDSSGWEDKQYQHDKAGSRKVGTRRPNRWGLHDMLGNVWEWCRDWYGDYEVHDQVNPGGPESGLFRVLRGGSWYFTARLARSASRHGYRPDYRGNCIGFRCAQVQG